MELVTQEVNYLQHVILKVSNQLCWYVHFVMPRENNSILMSRTTILYKMIIGNKINKLHELRGR